MGREKPRYLLERLLCFGHERVEELCVTLALEHLKRRFDPGLAQLAVRAHRVAEE